MLADFRNACTRRKQFDMTELSPDRLKRCLSQWELTFLGIGSTIGPGIYVITGQVARETAGPAVVLSYAIAAFACFFSAVCYAEFAVRLPRAGSSYTYCYATVGELLAFVVGWSVIFESIVGFSVVARAWSQYVDSFTNKTIQKHLEVQVLPGDEPTYFDVVAFTLVLAFTIVVAVGANVTSRANSIFTVGNIVVCVIIVGFGSYYANFENWNDFAPFGFSGAIKGAGRCFYVMLGFDVVATTSEETHDKKTVPRAMLLTLLSCCILYVSTAAILTLMVPWNHCSTTAAFATAFETVGLHWIKYVIIVGAMCSLSASVLGSLYAAARVTYSMANDGLIFKFLGIVPREVQTPVYATISAGIIGAFMALVFDLDSLIEMTSIGTLMAYTSVSASVLILRYQPWTLGFVQDEQTTIDEADKLISSGSKSDGYSSISDSRDVLLAEDVKVPHWTGVKEEIKSGCGRLFGRETASCPSERTGRFAMILTSTYAVLVAATALLAEYTLSKILEGTAWAVILFSILVCLLLANIIAFFLLPMNKTKLIFATPFMPVWPIVSLTLNLSVMMTLSKLSWIRVIIWLTLGMFIYTFYGTSNSRESRTASDQLSLIENDTDDDKNVRALELVGQNESEATERSHLTENKTENSPM